MKIRAVKGSGPAPDFVVEAETEQEMLLLRTFCHFKEYAKDDWKFTFGGSCYECDKNATTSFNFGWTKITP